MSMLNDFIELFFPEVCECCGNLLYRNEHTLCTRCRMHLPRTNFHLHPDNPVAAIFWGRVNFQYATSFLYFARAGRVQHLMHRFKYKGRRDIGLLLGGLFARELRRSENFSNIDMIIPVPLHWSKQKKRGYNQSEVISYAMAPLLNAHLVTEVLYRNSATETQTKKSRSLRAENVKGKFSIQYPEKIRGKHLLLIDDIITTGATIEACAQTLLTVDQVKVSIASLAYAGK
jgi:ComF family protein